MMDMDGEALANAIRVRRRINVSTSVKGVKTYDCTVETDDPRLTHQDVLNASDKLVADLEERYGIEKQLADAEALASELRKSMEVKA